MSPRTGRPKIDNSLCNDIKVRIDNELHKKLLDYCNRNGMKKAEAIRRAIIMFLDASK